MREPAGAGGRGGDGDVRPGSRERAPGDEDDERQAERPEHEPQHRSEIAGDERAEEGYAELPGLQSGSSRPSAAFAALARMNEKVGEAIQIHEHERVEGCAPRGQQRLALGPSADRAGDVQARRDLAPARKHEAPELGKGGVEAVALVLEDVDLRLRHAQSSLVLQRHREIGAEVEELVLYPSEHIADLFGALRGENEPERGVQLVDRSVRRDPEVELGGARAVPERGFARISAARVDLRQAHGLVSASRHVA